MLLTNRFFDMANFTILKPLSLLSCCGLSFPIVGLKTFSLPTLALRSPNRIFLAARGGVVVKALRYKPTGCGFDSRRCHWNFSVT